MRVRPFGASEERRASLRMLRRADIQSLEVFPILLIGHEKLFLGITLVMGRAFNLNSLKER